MNLKPISIEDLLESPFPASFYVVQDPDSGKFGCYIHEGIHGLACFESQVNANLFATDFDVAEMTIRHVTFDEAREIAKDRPAPVVCLMLLDNPAEPTLHFVR